MHSELLFHAHLQAYVDALDDRIKPLFKILFKTLRREGEFLEVCDGMGVGGECGTVPS